MNFLFSLNLFADFFSILKCGLFYNNSRKSAKIFVNNEKIETNNWRVLIFDDKINFYFLNMFLFMTSVVYCRTFFHLCRRYLIIKKLILKTYPLQMNPKEVFHNIAYSVQLPYIAGHSLHIVYVEWNSIADSINFNQF